MAAVTRQEEQMAIGVLLDFPGNTQAQNDDAAKKLTGGGRPEEAGRLACQGLLMHLAGPTKSGWRRSADNAIAGV
jgi:hypothetical protein